MSLYPATLHRAPVLPKHDLLYSANYAFSIFSFFQPEASDAKGTRKIRWIISMIKGDDAETLTGQGTFPPFWIKLTAVSH